MTVKHGWCVAILFAIAMTGYGQTAKERWVDSVFNSLSLNERIGQLFMTTVSGNESDQRLLEIGGQIKSYGLGGVLYKNGKSLRHASLTNSWQAESDLPLIVFVEGCAGIRNLTDTLMQFPRALVQGAIQNDTLLFHLGAEIGREMNLVGAHLNLLPANLITDPLSNNNSFGEDPARVADKLKAYWNGLHSQNALAGLKYYPIEKKLSTTNIVDAPFGVDSIREIPIRSALQYDVPLMIASAKDLPALSKEKKIAVKKVLAENELSPGFEADWIRGRTGFGGVIAVDMEQIFNSIDKEAQGDAEIFAFLAGNDLILNAANIPATIRKFKKIIRKEKNYRAQFDASVKRILSLKYDAGLHQYKPARTQNLEAFLASTDQKLLRSRLYRSGVTVVKNDVKLLPVIALEDRKYSCVVADDSIRGLTFFNAVSKYVHNDLVTVNDRKDIPSFYNALISKQVIIIAVFPTTKEETLQRLFAALSTKDPGREIIVCDFGSDVFKPYAQHFPTVVTALTHDDEMLRVVPEVVFGALPANGTLPISFGTLRPGNGIATQSLRRLSYSFPEDAEMDSPTLKKIESIANEAIAIGGTPGCHVLVARKGKVVYQKSFGHFTYEKVNKVDENTIYDLASVTKVAATLQAVMFIYEKGLIDINKKASVYLPELRNSNKKDYTLKDILTHQAGLWPFLPFWAQTMKDSVHLPQFYNDTLSTEYPYVVSDKLFAHKSMRDSLWTWIIKAKVREKAPRTPYDYRYSDMGFYILQHLAEKMLNQPMDDFLNQNLYEPLGAYTTGFLPLLRFPLRQIAPTENDKLFRKSLLIGMVHDQGAAMHGGIAGHAGLFSSGNDLAKLGQMLLQEGEYGGTRYFKPETVRTFASKQFATSVRGLGWHKPSGTWESATSLYASGKTFGHTGFTGTCIWVDPEFDLVYIFLSNRVHPDMTNNKLLNANIRSRIQDVVYQSIFEYCKKSGPAPADLENPGVNPIGGSQ